MTSKNGDFLDSPKSSKVKLTAFEKFCRQICPCFARKKTKAYREDVSRLNPNAGSTESNELQEVPKVPTDDLKTRRKPKNLFQSAIQTAPIRDEVAEYVERRRTIPVLPEDHIVQELHEHETLVLGRHPIFKLLTRISSVRFAPNRSVLEKCQYSGRHKHKGLFTNPKIDAFWSKRYVLFEKFDLGIRIDYSSWEQVLPEVVADYLAERCQCNTILDAYCGVGSASIKFSMRCRSVLAASSNFLRLECLENNARLYAADNIIKLNEEFLQLKNIKSDVVFIWPEWKDEPSEASEAEVIFREEVRPLMEKALSIAENFVMLLRPSADFPRLAEVLSGMLASNKHSACSAELEKIYFMDKLQYVAVYYGSLVNRQLKLSDELYEIYRILNDGHGTFHHVRVVKELREQYGMTFLLQLACECRDNLKNNTIEIFYEKIRLRKLIPPGRLQTLITQQTFEPGKIISSGRPSNIGRSDHTHSDTSECSLQADNSGSLAEGMRATRTDMFHVNS